MRYLFLLHVARKFVRYPISDAIATSIARYEKYCCWASKMGGGSESLLGKPGFPYQGTESSENCSGAVFAPTRFS